jgi:2-oxoglutarate ferredoxin oxidoreductase subunit gamma
MSRLASDAVQIRLTGAGGQGVITAGVILAEAALRDGQNVVQTQSYGPEARLGASKAEVIISRAPIAYPEVTVPDILLCLSKDSARKYIGHVHKGKGGGPKTIVVLDSSAEGVEADGEEGVYRLPLAETAAACGNKAATNVVALWALNSIAQVVTPANLREAILARVPARFKAGNERAIAAAQEMMATFAPLAAPPTSSLPHPPTHEGNKNGTVHAPVNGIA